MPTDPQHLAQRHFFVTGTASGIGRHLVARLLAAGATVAAAHRDDARLARVADEDHWPRDRLTLVNLDVRNADAWQRALDTAETARGPIDVLINVAGAIAPNYVRDLIPADVHNQLDVNTKGVIFGTHAAVARMRPRNRGHIINIASLAGTAPIAGNAVYSASKYAVRAFSLAAAQELRDSGIYVTVVCPDAVKTPMLDLQRHSEAATMTFSGRLLTVEEIGDVVMGRVLDKKPLEVWVPFHRGVLARFGDLFPEIARVIMPRLLKLGSSQQQGYAKTRDDVLNPPHKASKHS